MLCYCNCCVRAFAASCVGSECPEVRGCDCCRRLVCTVGVGVEGVCIGALAVIVVVVAVVVVG
eukprot:2334211-Alexandrium_andersonii.AAC.1